MPTVEAIAHRHGGLPVPSDDLDVTNLDELDPDSLGAYIRSLIGRIETWAASTGADFEYAHSILRDADLAQAVDLI